MSKPITEKRRRCPSRYLQIVKKLKDHGSRAGPMNGRRRKNNKDRKGKDWDAKRTQPEGYYRRYERERGGEGKRTRIRAKALLTLLNDIYEPRSATGKRMISYLACLVDKEFRGHSYRAHVSYRVTPGFTAHVWPKKSSLKVVLTPYGRSTRRMRWDTGGGRHACGGRGARIPAGGFQRVLHNA